MDTGSAFVAHRQASKPMQPREGAFDDPPGAAQAAAVRRAALGELRPDTTPLQLVAVRLGIVPAIALHEAGLTCGAARATAQLRHRIHQGEQLRDVVPIRRRQDRDERNPVRVGENMMLRPGFAAIGRVRSSFFPRATRGATRCRRPRA